MTGKLSVEALSNMNRFKFYKVKDMVRRIIISKLSKYMDLDEYMEDLVSNAFIVLLRSVNSYNSGKSQFSTYAYNRIVASSKKLYLSLKYPYAGIIALTGKKRELQDLFLSSSLAYISSIDDMDIELPDLKTMEDY